MSATSDLENAFIAAVAEDPDNDFPRLIFADWLDEEGDTRGEFIRLQCQMKSLSGQDLVWAEMRERELLLESGADWGGWSPAGLLASFSRGFLTVRVVALTAGAEQWLHRFGRWVVSLGVSNLPETDFRALVAGGYVPHAGTLVFGWHTDSILTELATLKCLASLDLSQLHVYDERLPGLQVLEHLKTLSLPKGAHNEWGLRHLIRLCQPTTLDLARWEMDESILEQVRALGASLHRLNLEGTNTDDRALGSLIDALPDLRQLNLVQTRVTDVVLAQLVQLADLEELAISCPPISTAGLRPLAELTRLRSVEIESSRSWGKGLTRTFDSVRESVLEALTALADFPVLETVHLDRCTVIEGPDLAGIPSSHSWRKITLGALTPGDEGLRQVMRLTQPRHLNLSGWSLTNNGLAALAGATLLEELILQEPGVNDAGLKHLAGLFRLRLLDLQKTQVTDAGLGELRDLPRLTELRLTDPGKPGYSPPYYGGHGLVQACTDTGLTHLIRLTRPRRLDLSNWRVSWSGLEQLAELAPLEELILPTTMREGKGLCLLAQFARPERLDLRSWRLSDSDLPALATMTTLRQLCLPRRITDTGLAVLETLPHLQELEMSWTQATDACLETLISLSALRRVRLNIHRISDRAVARLRGIAHVPHRPLSLIHKPVLERTIATGQGANGKPVGA